MKKKSIYISIIVILLLLLIGAAWCFLHNQSIDKPSLPTDSNAVEYEGDTFNLRLNVNDSDHVAEFVKNQTTSEFIVTGQPVEGEMPAAGYYTGTVEFVVELGVKPPQY